MQGVTGIMAIAVKHDLFFRVQSKVEQRVVGSGRNARAAKGLLGAGEAGWLKQRWARQQSKRSEEGGSGVGAAGRGRCGWELGGGFMDRE